MKLHIKILILVVLVGLVPRGSDIVAQAISSQELDRTAGINLPPVQYFSNSDGDRLAHYSFEPRGKARAILLLYHAAGRRVAIHYPILARRLVLDHRIAVHLIDVRGRAYRGDSSRRKPLTRGRIWKDVREMTRLMRRRHPGLPLYLGGHGRGAGLILNYSAWKRKSSPDGYVFLAPDLGYGLRAQHADVRREVMTPATCIVMNGEDPSRLESPPAVLPAGRIPVSRESDVSAAVVPRNPRKQFRALDRPAALFVGARDEKFSAREVMALAGLIRTRKIARVLPGSGHFSLLLETAASIAGFMGS